MPILSATLSAPALLRLAETDVRAVGKIQAAIWVDSDTVGISDIEWGSLDE
jgi:hypothetical protein